MTDCNSGIVAPDQSELRSSESTALTNHCASLGAAGNSRSFERAVAPSKIHTAVDTDPQQSSLYVLPGSEPLSLITKDETCRMFHRTLRDPNLSRTPVIRKHSQHV